MIKEEIGLATLYYGDCIEILPEIKSWQYDICLTDPPYLVNTVSDPNRKISVDANMINARFFYEKWYSEIERVLNPDAAFWSFYNWRSMAVVQMALMKQKTLKMRSNLIWDKNIMGLEMIGLRPCYEMVFLATQGDFKIAKRDIKDIQKFQSSSNKATGHPAEKPESLLSWILEITGGGSVIDPFMGSGTTGVSAIKQGRKFCGIEYDQKWFEYACKRLETEQSQGQFL